MGRNGTASESETGPKGMWSIRTEGRVAVLSGLLHETEMEQKGW